MVSLTKLKESGIHGGCDMMTIHGATSGVRSEATISTATHGPTGIAVGVGQCHP